MIRAVLFDLDDTLYPEEAFYRGGFAVVAAELERRGIGPADEIGQHMLRLHLGGSRPRVFDLAAERFGFSPSWVSELVSLFHGHEPRLSLYSDVRGVLERLGSRYHLGVVTDGHGGVQRRKIAALGVEPLVDAVVVADDFGRPYWKPHPRPFLACCQAIGVLPDEAVYVGDNPERDVAGARSAGLLSIRMRRPDGFFRNAEEGSSGSAAHEVESLRELEEWLDLIAAETVVP